MAATDDQSDRRPTDAADGPGPARRETLDGRSPVRWQLIGGPPPVHQSVDSAHQPVDASGSVHHQVVELPGSGHEGANDLTVSEVFGPTFQGEGPSIGRRAMFVRLGRCNLDCRWCDTPYTWDWKRFDRDAELHRRSVPDVVAQLEAIGATLLVVTGGEPLLQQHRLVALLEATNARGWRTEIETNGTLAPIPELAALVDQWNVSPKLTNSGISCSRRWKPDAVRALARTGRAIGKFVVAHPSELDEVQAMVDESNLAEVWVMPEGSDAATVAGRLVCLAPAVLERGWNLSGRLHVQLWGDARGA